MSPGKYSEAVIKFEPAGVVCNRAIPGEARQRPETCSITRRMPVGTDVKNLEPVPSKTPFDAGTLNWRIVVRNGVRPGLSISLTRPTIGMDCAVVLVTTTCCAVAGVAENAGAEGSRLMVSRTMSPKRLAKMLLGIVFSPDFCLG